ncbi:hypothetical protein O181_082856 [Austropuccinia psidii MF-1]|uniref:Uncharacterized protein n=1 Tax=Austropuccinia psidii MF-1 TaxID=1389203 RepID=A0A9Q3FTG8_9BASI|nr:hypothetical protein [Austropuccinia psidii MF-1]
MSYSEQEALNQLEDSSSWPKSSGTREYNHMGPIDYIYLLFIDVPIIPDYWITSRLNTEFKGHASIWYTEMKEIHGRGSWPWWKSEIIQNYSSDEESQTPDTNARELEHAVRCRCNQSCTLDDIANILQDVRKRTNIEKFTPYKSSGFKETQPFRVDFKDKPKEKIEEAKKKVYAIEQVPEGQSPTEYSESDSMGDAIREQSDDDQDPIEEFLVEYQEETQREIHHKQLEAGIPQILQIKTCVNTHKMHKNSY